MGSLMTFGNRSIAECYLSLISILKIDIGDANQDAQLTYNQSSFFFKHPNYAYGLQFAEFYFFGSFRGECFALTHWRYRHYFLTQNHFPSVYF